MSILLNKMGLVAWDDPDDNYDGGEMANNMAILDEHNHTEGKGNQIPSGGLADNSVTNPKIADGAVGGSELQDGAVTTPKIADDAVTRTKLPDEVVGTDQIEDASVTGVKLADSIVPLGTVIMWYRKDDSVPLPEGGWEVLDGRNWASVPNDLGYSTGSMPNAINRFPLGAAVSGGGGGSNSGTPVAIGTLNGSHVLNLAHTHGIGPHSHPILPHSHPISGDGAHRHRFVSTIGLQSAKTREVGVQTGIGERQALFVPGLHGTGGGSVDALLEWVENHDHGGTTGQVTGQSTQNSTTYASDAASVDLSAVDNRPAFVGFLFLIKARI